MTTLLYKFLLKRRHSSSQGFTLIEVLAVVVLIGILSAIVAPNWIAFNDNQKLTAARNDIYSALSEASSTAKRDRVTTQFSIVENTSTGQLYWATSRADTTAEANTTRFIPILLPTPANLSSANAATRQEASLWKPIDRRVRIDTTVPTGLTNSRTTFRLAVSSGTPSFNGWRIQFNEKGLPFEATDALSSETPRFPKRVTFTLRNRRTPTAPISQTAPRACVSITTILGGLQSGRNQDCQG